MSRLLLLKPLLTEKTMRLAKTGQFTFKVAKFASKTAISAAAAAQFKVNVIKVTCGRTGVKLKRTGRRRLINAVAGSKKAIITLKSGQTLEFFKIPEKQK